MSAKNKNPRFRDAFKLHIGLSLMEWPDRNLIHYSQTRVRNIYYGPGIDPARARFVSEHAPPPIPVWQDSALVEKWKNKLHHNS